MELLADVDESTIAPPKSDQMQFLQLLSTMNKNISTMNKNISAMSISLKRLHESNVSDKSTAQMAVSAKKARVINDKEPNTHTHRFLLHQTLIPIVKHCSVATINHQTKKRKANKEI